MRTITFTRNHLKETKNSTDKPVIHFDKVVFNSDITNWVSRLCSASFTVKIACIDNKKQERKSTQMAIPIGGLISPFHKQPVITINKKVLFESSENDFFTKDAECTSWRTTIELNNLELKDNETMTLEIMEREHVLKRVQDWKKRVRDLYKEMGVWIKEKQGLDIVIGRPIRMYEEMMQEFEIPEDQIDTADILEKKRIILTFKPKGLWIIGANGRVDIISKRGNYILVDTGHQFQPANWYIHSIE